MEGEIPELLKPISWLVGTWETKTGVGYYPTISNFGYHETVEFRYCGKQPLLAYSGSSSHPERGNPMHLESGFLRSRDGDSLAFMVAHNFGLATVEEGSVKDRIIVLKSTSVGRMTGAKDPCVIEIERKFTLVDENTLIQELSMATSNTTKLTEHLKATYTRK